MADSRPSVLARFVPNKLIGTVKNCVATLNWMISCWNMIKPGKGISITGVASGRPVVGLNLEAGEGVTIEDAGGGEFSSALKISATGGGGGGIEDIIVDSGSDSNVEAVVDVDEGIATITIDVYYV